MSPEPAVALRLAELKEKVEKDPRSRLFVQLADEYRRAGQLGEAIAVIRRGLEHHPGYVAALNALGKLYVESGRDLDSQPVFERSLVLDPQNVVAARFLGDVHYRRGQLVEAIKKYKLVRAIAPGDEELEALILSIEERIPPYVRAGDEAVAASGVAETIVKPAVPSMAVAPAAAPRAAVSGESFDDESFPFDEGGLVPGGGVDAPGNRGGDFEASDMWRDTTASPAPLAAEDVRLAEEPAREATADLGTASISPSAVLAQVGRPEEVSGPVAGLVGEPVSESPNSMELAGSDGDRFASVGGMPGGSSDEASFGDRAERWPAGDQPGVEAPRAVGQAESAAAPSSGTGATLTLADLYLSQGHPQEAQAVLQEILAHDPGNVAVAARLMEIARPSMSGAELVPNQVAVLEGPRDAREVVADLVRWLNLIKCT